MPLSHIEHYLVQTEDIARTRDWYVEVLGLEEGPHPDFGFPVHWLYLNGCDVVHVTAGGAGVSEERKRYVGQDSEATRGTGVVDHIAFRASGLVEILEHLDRLGIERITRRADAQALFQVFVKDPNGVKIELNFPAEEADGVAPELTASAFERPS